MTSSILRAAALAALSLGGLFAAGAAHAGACPREHVLTTPRPIENAPDVGVERETLDQVHLKGWREVGDLFLRMRRLTIAVNGIVPFHAHDDRPSVVYIISGEIEELSTHCAVPIRHRAGEWAAEFGAQDAHWWRNVGNVPVVIISADLVPPDMMPDPHM